MSHHIIPFAESSPVLTLAHVAVVLGGCPVLHDIDTRIGRGEFAGLIGANGAGKTALLRVILGRPRAGSRRIAVPSGVGRDGAYAYA